MPVVHGIYLDADSGRVIAFLGQIRYNVVSSYWMEA